MSVHPPKAHLALVVAPSMTPIPNVMIRRSWVVAIETTPVIAADGITDTATEAPDPAPTVTVQLPWAA